MVRLVRRNLVAAIVAALLALGFLAYAVASAPAMYHASGSAVLFSPAPPPDPTQSADGTNSVPVAGADNPYVRFNDLSVVVDIIRRVLVGSDVAQKLRAEGVVGTYTVAANIDFYRGPIIDIATDAPTAEGAQKSTKLVMTELGNVLDQLQAQQGTAPAYRISTQDVVEPQLGTRVLSSTLRRGMAATVVAAGLFIGIIVVADALRRRRSRKGVPTAMPARSDDDDETALQDDRQAGDRLALEIVPSRSPSEQAEKRHFRSARLSATSDSDVARPVAVRRRS